MGILIESTVREQIETLVTHGSTQAIRRRAKLLLLYDDGLTTVQVAEQVDLSTSRTRYWRRRFVSEGMEIFTEEPLPIEQITEPVPLEQESIAPAPQEASQEEVSSFVEASPTQEGETEIRPVTLEDLRQRYPTNLRRAEHRRDLALTLFDGTRSIHRLPIDQRKLLEAAALLQCLTEKQEAKQANKSGYIFILSHPLIDLSEEENKKVEAILSYQNGDADHQPHGGADQPISPADLEVLALASLLRIADGLDSSQSQGTNIDSIESDPLELKILVSGPTAKKDARKGRKSAKLWSMLFGQKVRLQSVTQMDQGLDESMSFLLELKSPGVEPKDPLSEAGRKVLIYNFAQMVRHEAGTRLGEDIEELHDMRVATRRMRAAFEVFADAFERKSIKKHLKGLRATGRALGRVRDLDVFMEKASHYLDTLPGDQHQGLEPLLNLWEKERENDRDKMLKYLNSEAYENFKRDFLDFLTTPGKGAKTVADTDPHLVRHVVPVLIYSRMAAVRAYGPTLDSATISQLHMLRIEFKKLRYSLEFFREVLGEGSKELIKEIKNLQDHLGDLNDADVACNILRQFLDDWESRQVYKPISERDNPEPIVAYLAAKHAERYFLISTFHDVWLRFDQPQMRSKLATAIAIL